MGYREAIGTCLQGKPLRAGLLCACAVAPLESFTCNDVVRSLEAELRFYSSVCRRALCVARRGIRVVYSHGCL